MNIGVARHPRAARLVEAAAGATSAAALLVTAVAVRPGSWAVALPVLLAIVWSTAVPVAHALAPRRAPVTPVPSAGAGTWTTVVRVGREPDELARTSIGLAVAAGPTVVITTRPADEVGLLTPVGVAVVSRADAGEAVRDAARLVRTDGVLLVSAGAFPIASVCRAAAAALDHEVAWVVGRSTTFNVDGFGSDRRSVLGERLRSRARDAGADLWEPDATMVRTDLLRDAPLDDGRPRGRWLRDARRRGARGRTTSDTLTTRIVPPAADGFWPATVTRQRALVADLADASTVGPPRARLLTAALALRELHAYPAMLVVLSPLALSAGGAFPVQWRPVLVGALLAVAVVLRWVALRVVHGCALRPAADAAAAVFDLPGSLLALPAAVSRRVRPARLGTSDRPLVWMALALTVATSVPLVGGAAGRGTTGRTAAALALVELVLLWQLALRAMLRRRWSRQAWRAEVTVPVTIDGHPATTLDASAAGVAVVGAFAHLPVGATATFEVLAADGPLTATIRVTSRRPLCKGHVLGCALELAPADRLRWAGVVLLGASPGRTPAPTTQALRPERARAWAERAVLAVVAVVTVPVVAALVAVLLGYRPLVVRSTSMVPTFHVGDVALVDVVAAGEVHRDDVVTYTPVGTDDTTTHRVRAVENDGATTTFETRGDANDVSEYWSRPATAPVGRVVLRVPRGGGVIAALGEHRGPLGLGIVVGGALAAMGLHLGRPLRPARRVMTGSPPAG